MHSIAGLYQRDMLKVLGLMSGTSLDGLDICLAHVYKQNFSIRAELVSFKSYPYTEEFRSLFQQLLQGSTEQLCSANFAIAREYERLISIFLEEQKKQVQDIDLIGSHGQTVWHIHRDSTLQLGEASVLAEAFKVPVISDFRVRDVAAGGSGAPLVPYIDYILFKNYNKNFMILNIGGMANFTMIPAKTTSIDDIYALDTGPGVALIDSAARLISKYKRHYDLNAEYAKMGRIRPDILEFLMNQEFIGAPLPKSTGRESFGDDFLNQVIKHFELKEHELLDLIATLTRFTAAAIYSNYKQFFEQKYRLDEIVVSGGGANNPQIITHLKDLFRGIKISRIEDYGINGDAKEAFAFAILAALNIWQLSGNIPNATGASHPVILGKITI